MTELAETYEDKPAVVMDSGPTLSFRQLEIRSNQIAHYFRECGLRPGDHVAILLENCLDMFTVAMAAQRTGLYYTPVNWHLNAQEVTYVVANCGARLLIHSEKLSSLAVFAEAGAPDLVRRIVAGSTPDTTSGVASLDVVVDGLPEDPVADEREGYYMFYSSGTTGRPKGILPERPEVPFGTGLNIDHLLVRSFGFTPESVYLSPGPLYHAAPLGWSLGTIRNGGTVVVMERFDAEQALRLVAGHQITHAQFVPTMFVRMLKLPASVRQRYDLSSLQMVVHAAAPCPMAVKDRMIQWVGPILTEFYSATEGTGFFVIDTEEWLSHRGSVGRAIRGVVHICDDDGEELPVGEIGTVWFSGTGRFRYHRDPDKTADAFNNRGWTTLGDLGHVDDDGYLYLSARRTDLILSGGVNIYPQEIEDLLVLHPSVADVAVIGIPDAEMGQRVHAVVELADQVAPGPDIENALIDYCREHLARFKTPRSMSFGPIPRSPIGKLLRRKIIDNCDDENKEPNSGRGLP